MTRKNIKFLAQIFSGILLFTGLASGAAFQYGGLRLDLLTVTSSSSTVALTKAHKQVNVATGSSNQVYTLPDATGLSAGYWYKFVNESSGTLTVSNSSSVALTTLAQNESATLYVKSSATTGGPWSVQKATPTSSGGSGSTNASRFVCGKGAGDANTLAMLNFNAATVIDYVASPPTWTLQSGTVTSATQAKFGARSLDSNGGNGVNTPSTSANILGSGDFTVDFWMYATSGVKSGSYGIGGNGGGSSQWGLRTNGGNIQWYTNSAQVTSYAWTSGVSDNTWVHIAIVRSSGTLSVYRNGTSIGSVAESTNYNATGAALYVGYNALSTENFGGSGYIDEFRISNNARWTSNFTPDASAYAITNTISVNPSSWITSVSGGGATGECTVNFSLASEPACTCSIISSTAGESSCRFTANNTTTAAALSTRINGALADASVYFNCLYP